MEIVDGIVWGIIFAMILLALVLIFQAAYIRSRLDLLAPATISEPDMFRCEQCHSIIRAYSVRINVPATRALVYRDVRVTALSQLGYYKGTDVNVATGAKMLDPGTYTAKWLVLRGSDSGGTQADRLRTDVLDGLVMYLLMSNRLYIVTCGMGSKEGIKMEADAQKEAGNHSSSADVYLLICDIDAFAKTFELTVPDPDYALLNPRGPFQTNGITASSDTSTTTTNLQSEVASATTDLYKHVWGYAGTSPTQAMTKPLIIIDNQQPNR